MRALEGTRFCFRRQHYPMIFCILAPNRCLDPVLLQLLVARIEYN